MGRKSTQEQTSHQSDDKPSSATRAQLPTNNSLQRFLLKKQSINKHHNKQLESITKIQDAKSIHDSLEVRNNNDNDTNISNYATDISINNDLNNNGNNNCIKKKIEDKTKNNFLTENAICILTPISESQINLPKAQSQQIPELTKTTDKSTSFDGQSIGAETISSSQTRQLKPYSTKRHILDLSNDAFNDQEMFTKKKNASSTQTTSEVLFNKQKRHLLRNEISKTPSLLNNKKNDPSCSKFSSSVVDSLIGNDSNDKQNVVVIKTSKKENETNNKSGFIDIDNSAGHIDSVLPISIDQGNNIDNKENIKDVIMTEKKKKVKIAKQHTRKSSSSKNIIVTSPVSTAIAPALSEQDLSPKKYNDNDFDLIQTVNDPKITAISMKHGFRPSNKSPNCFQPSSYEPTQEHDDNSDTIVRDADNGTVIDNGHLLNGNNDGDDDNNDDLFINKSSSTMTASNWLLEQQKKKKKNDLISASSSTTSFINKSFNELSPSQQLYMISVNAMKLNKFDPFSLYPIILNYLTNINQIPSFGLVQVLLESDFFAMKYSYFMSLSPPLKLQYKMSILPFDLSLYTDEARIKWYTRQLPTKHLLSSHPEYTSLKWAARPSHPAYPSIISHISPPCFDRNVSCQNYWKSAEPFNKQSLASFFELLSSYRYSKTPTCTLIDSSQQLITSDTLRFPELEESQTSNQRINSPWGIFTHESISGSYNYTSSTHTTSNSSYGDSSLLINICSVLLESRLFSSMPSPSSPSIISTLTPQSTLTFWEDLYPILIKLLPQFISLHDETIITPSTEPSVTSCDNDPNSVHNSASHISLHQLISLSKLNPLGFFQQLYLDIIYETLPCTSATIDFIQQYLNTFERRNILKSQLTNNLVSIQQENVDILKHNSTEQTFQQKNCINDPFTLGNEIIGQKVSSVDNITKVLAHAVNIASSKLHNTSLDDETQLTSSHGSPLKLPPNENLLSLLQPNQHITPYLEPHVLPAAAVLLIAPPGLDTATLLSLATQKSHFQLLETNTSSPLNIREILSRSLKAASTRRVTSSSLISQQIKNTQQTKSSLFDESGHIDDKELLSMLSATDSNGNINATKKHSQTKVRSGFFSTLNKKNNNSTSSTPNSTLFDLDIDSDSNKSSHDELITILSSSEEYDSDSIFDDSDCIFDDSDSSSDSDFEEKSLKKAGKKKASNNDPSSFQVTPLTLKNEVSTLPTKDTIIKAPKIEHKTDYLTLIQRAVYKHFETSHNVDFNVGTVLHYENVDWMLDEANNLANISKNQLTSQMQNTSSSNPSSFFPLQYPVLSSQQHLPSTVQGTTISASSIEKTFETILSEAKIPVVFTSETLPAFFRKSYSDVSHALQYSTDEYMISSSPSLPSSSQQSPLSLLQSANKLLSNSLVTPISSQHNIHDIPSSYFARCTASHVHIIHADLDQQRHIIIVLFFCLLDTILSHSFDLLGVKHFSLLPQLLQCSFLSSILNHITNLCVSTNSHIPTICSQLSLERGYITKLWDNSNNQYKLQQQTQQNQNKNNSINNYQFIQSISLPILPSITAISYAPKSLTTVSKNNPIETSHSHSFPLHTISAPVSDVCFSYFKSFYPSDTLESSSQQLSKLQSLPAISQSYDSNNPALLSSSESNPTESPFAAVSRRCTIVNAISSALTPKSLGHWTSLGILNLSNMNNILNNMSFPMVTPSLPSNNLESIFQPNLDLGQTISSDQALSSAISLPKTYCYVHDWLGADIPAPINLYQETMFQLQQHGTAWYSSLANTAGPPSSITTTNISTSCNSKRMSRGQNAKYSDSSDSDDDQNLYKLYDIQLAAKKTGVSPYSFHIDQKWTQIPQTSWEWMDISSSTIPMMLYYDHTIRDICQFPSLTTLSNSKSHNLIQNELSSHISSQYSSSSLLSSLFTDGNTVQNNYHNSYLDVDVYNTTQYILPVSSSLLIEPLSQQAPQLILSTSNQNSQIKKNIKNGTNQNFYFDFEPYKHLGLSLSQFLISTSCTPLLSQWPYDFTSKNPFLSASSSNLHSPSCLANTPQQHVPTSTPIPISLIPTPSSQISTPTSISPLPQQNTLPSSQITDYLSKQIQSLSFSDDTQNYFAPSAAVIQPPLANSSFPTTQVDNFSLLPTYYLTSSYQSGKFVFPSSLPLPFFNPSDPHSSLSSIYSSIYYIVLEKLNHEKEKYYDNNKPAKFDIPTLNHAQSKELSSMMEFILENVEHPYWHIHYSLLTHFAANDDIFALQQSSVSPLQQSGVDQNLSSSISYFMHLFMYPQSPLINSNEMDITQMDITQMDESNEIKSQIKTNSYSLIATPLQELTQIQTQQPIPFHKMNCISDFQLLLSTPHVGFLKRIRCLKFPNMHTSQSFQWNTTMKDIPRKSPYVVIGHRFVLKDHETMQKRLTRVTSLQEMIKIYNKLLHIKEKFNSKHENDNYRSILLKILPMILNHLSIDTPEHFLESNSEICYDLIQPDIVYFLVHSLQNSTYFTDYLSQNTFNYINNTSFTLDQYLSLQKKPEPHKTSRHTSKYEDDDSDNDSIAIAKSDDSLGAESPLLQPSDVEGDKSHTPNNDNIYNKSSVNIYQLSQKDLIDDNFDLTKLRPKNRYEQNLFRNIKAISRDDTQLHQAMITSQPLLHSINAIMSLLFNTLQDINSNNDYNSLLSWGGSFVDWCTLLLDCCNKQLNTPNEMLLQILNTVPLSEVSQKQQYDILQQMELLGSANTNKHKNNTHFDNKLITELPVIQIILQLLSCVSSSTLRYIWCPYCGLECSCDKLSNNSFSVECEYLCISQQSYKNLISASSNNKNDLSPYHCLQQETSKPSILLSGCLDFDITSHIDNLGALNVDLCWISKEQLLDISRSCSSDCVAISEYNAFLYEMKSNLSKLNDNLRTPAPNIKLDRDDDTDSSNTMLDSINCDSDKDEDNDVKATLDNLSLPLNYTPWSPLLDISVPFILNTTSINNSSYSNNKNNNVLFTSHNAYSSKLNPQSSVFTKQNVSLDFLVSSTEIQSVIDYSLSHTAASASRNINYSVGSSQLNFSQKIINEPPLRFNSISSYGNDLSIGSLHTITYDTSGMLNDISMFHSQQKQLLPDFSSIKHFNNIITKKQIPKKAQKLKTKAVNKRKSTDIKSKLLLSPPSISYSSQQQQLDNTLEAMSSPTKRLRSVSQISSASVQLQSPSNINKTVPSTTISPTAILSSLSTTIPKQLTSLQHLYLKLYAFSPKFRYIISTCFTHRPAVAAAIASANNAKENDIDFVFTTKTWTLYDCLFPYARQHRQKLHLYGVYMYYLQLFTSILSPSSIVTSKLKTLSSVYETLGTSSRQQSFEWFAADVPAICYENYELSNNIDSDSHLEHNHPRMLNTNSIIPYMTTGDSLQSSLWKLYRNFYNQNCQNNQAQSSQSISTTGIHASSSPSVLDWSDKTHVCSDYIFHCTSEITSALTSATMNIYYNKILALYYEYNHQQLSNCVLLYKSIHISIHQHIFALTKRLKYYSEMYNTSRLNIQSVSILSSLHNFFYLHHAIKTQASPLTNNMRMFVFPYLSLISQYISIHQHNYFNSLSTMPSTNVDYLSYFSQISNDYVDRIQEYSISQNDTYKISPNNSFVPLDTYKNQSNRRISSRYGTNMLHPIIYSHPLVKPTDSLGYLPYHLLSLYNLCNLNNNCFF